jgi:hypothetical protein
VVVFEEADLLLWSSALGNFPFLVARGFCALSLSLPPLLSSRDFFFNDGGLKNVR